MRLSLADEVEPGRGEQAPPVFEQRPIWSLSPRWHGGSIVNDNGSPQQWAERAARAADRLNLIRVMPV